MSDRYKLNETRSPIDPSSWRELNQNWELIQSYLRFLERQIKFLAGGKEIDEILIRIDTAIENAENATEDAEAAKREVDNALQQLEALVTSTQNAANNANTAARDANTLNTALTALKRELETLQTNLNSIVQSEAQRVSAENIRRENEAARSLKEQARESAEQQRNTTFDSKITEADQKTASMQDLIRNLVSYSYAPGTTYVFPNLVKWNGSTFIALRRVTGITPVDDGVNYRLVAEKGAKGDTGAGINVLGRFDDASELPTTGSIGDAYIIGINLYVWGGTNWVDGGPIQGPKGDTATSTTFFDFVINASDTTQVALSSGVTINPTGYSYNADTDTFEVYRNSRILYPRSDYTIENGSIRVAQSVTEPDKTTFYIRVTRVVYRIDEDAGRETIVNALGYTPANDSNLAEVAKQLAQTATKAEVSNKRDKNVPITLNDAGSDLLSAIQGNTTVNVLSKPQDRSVSPLSTDFVQIGKNIFNKNDVTPNTTISTSTSSGGQLVEADGYSTSSFVRVTPSTSYVRSGTESKIAFYDIDKKYISLSDWGVGVLTTPANAYYSRINYYSKKGELGNVLQVELGTNATSYESYHIKMPNVLLDSINLQPIPREKIKMGAVDDTLLAESIKNSIYANAKVTSINNRALLCVPAMAAYSYSVIESMNSEGIGVEVTSIVKFAIHHQEWAENFDVLVFGFENIDLPYLTAVSASKIKSALSSWLAKGKKIIYHTPSSRHSIRIYGADGGVAEEVSLSDILPVTLTAKSFMGTGSFSKTAYYPNDHDDILESKYVPNGSVRHMVMNTGLGVLPLIEAREGDNVSTVVAFKPKSFAIVGYGGSSGGIENMSAYRYLSFGKLAKMLIGDTTKVRMAMDCKYGRKIAAFGIDGDSSAEVEPYDMFIRAFKKGALELGLTAEKLTQPVINKVRGSVGNIEINSHSSRHMETFTLTETYTIPDNLVVSLDHPYWVETKDIKSVKSKDGSTIFAYKGSWRNIVNAPAVGQYSYDGQGRFLFNQADKGKEIEIIYVTVDEAHEWLGSIDVLNGLKLLTNDSIYLTGKYNSLHDTSLAYGIRKNIVFCDHDNINMRSEFLMNGELLQKFVPLVSPTMKMGEGLSLFDDAIFNTTKENAKTATFPFMINRANKWNQPYVWYSHDYPFTQLETRSIFKGSSKFNPDWKKSTYTETLAYCEEMFVWIVDQLNAKNVYWQPRSDYSRFYNELNQNIVYSPEIKNGSVFVTVENRGDKKIEGITFREKRNSVTSVKILPERTIPYTLIQNELMFSVDLSPGESKTIIITG